MSTPRWLWLEREPSDEPGEFRWALVVDFDNDIAEWQLENISVVAGHIRFRVQIYDNDGLDGLQQALDIEDVNEPRDEERPSPPDPLVR
jgi:hypothetical protein